MSSTKFTATKTAPATKGVPETIEQSVEKAELLLAYAANRGLKIEDKLIEALVNAKASLAESGSSVSAQTEAQFWCALRDIAQKIKPASFDSIEARSEKGGERVLTLRGFRIISRAQSAVRRYQLTSLFSLFVLLTVQLYAGTGGKILNGLEDVEHKIVDKRQEISTLNNELLLSASGDSKWQEIRSKQADAKEELDFLSKDLRARYRLLDIWNPFRALRDEEPAAPPPPAIEDNQSAAALAPGSDAVAFAADPALAPAVTPTLESALALNTAGDEASGMATGTDKQAARGVGKTSSNELSELLARSVTPQPRESPAAAAVALPQAGIIAEEQFREHIVLAGRIALEALNLYFLPLVYGLLGACAYVLRRLSTEVREYTYSPESDIRLKLRLYLGALSGFAIAWFINQVTTPGLADTITPMALAFLAGYSVEVVFAAMDNLVNAFSRDSHSARTRDSDKA